MMPKNDLQDREILQQLFPSFFSKDQPPPKLETVMEEDQTLIAAILVVEKCKVFIWIPGIVTNETIDTLRCEIEKINKKTDGTTEVCRVSSNGCAHAMIVCPKCLSGNESFVRRCKLVIKRHIKSFTVQHIREKDFIRAFPSLGTI